MKTEAVDGVLATLTSEDAIPGEINRRYYDKQLIETNILKPNI